MDTWVGILLDFNPLPTLRTAEYVARQTWLALANTKPEAPPEPSGAVLNTLLERFTGISYRREISKSPGPITGKSSTLNVFGVVNAPE